jgi:hypothetical protein
MEEMQVLTLKRCIHAKKKPLSGRQKDSGLFKNYKKVEDLEDSPIWSETPESWKRPTEESSKQKLTKVRSKSFPKLKFASLIKWQKEENISEEHKSQKSEENFEFEAKSASLEIQNAEILQNLDSICSSIKCDLLNLNLLNLVSTIDPANTIPLPTLSSHLKKTIILDFEGVIILSESRNFQKWVQVQETFPHSLKCRTKELDIRFLIRPYFENVFVKLANFCEIIIWTNEISTYANDLVEFIDPERKLFSKVIRKSGKQKKIIRDLALLKKRKLGNIVMLSDKVIHSAYQIDNLYLIPKFEAKQDDALRHFFAFIKKNIDSLDIRKQLKSRFSLQQAFQFINNKI